MKLELTFGEALCYTTKFLINNIEADYYDFGEKYDRNEEEAEEYGCEDMQFTRLPSTPEILIKYKITEAEYEEVASQLKEGLSFGECGWCV